MQNGALFIATPNRNSLGPDPHTGIWAGSLLPQSVTASLVRRQGGIPPQRHLLSARTLRRLLKGADFGRIEIFTPQITPGQQAQLSNAMRVLARLYNSAAALPGSRHLLQIIGPLLYAVAVPRSV
jgi:hypothetical protein